ncbi:helix-turn-helix domain-containing protein [Mesorhizobium sp. M0991]
MEESRDLAKKRNSPCSYGCKGGENVSRLADELGIHRQRLYSWREQLRVCGNLTPSRQGRPKKRPPEAPPDHWRQVLHCRLNSVVPMG